MNNVPGKRKKLSINFIDILLIMIIVFSLLFLVYMVFFFDSAIFGNNADHKDGWIKIVLRAEQVDDSYKVDIAEGDEAVNATEAFVIGNVQSCARIGASKKVTAEQITDTDGETSETKTVTVYSSYPDRSDYEIVVTAYSTVNEGTYTIDGHEIRLGDEFMLNTGYFGAKVICVSITEVTASEETGGELDG